MPNDEIRSRKYAEQKLYGMRKTPISRFTNLPVNLMDLDMVILLRNWGLLACEMKCLTNARMVKAESITIQSISYAATKVGHESYWVKLVHHKGQRVLTEDNVYVGAYGIGNTLIGDELGETTLRQFKEKLNRGLPNLVPNYEKYRPVRCDFMHQAHHQGVIFGLNSIYGNDLTAEEVQIWKKLADYMTLAGADSRFLLCQYEGLDAGKQIDLYSGRILHEYVDGVWQKGNGCPADAITEFAKEYEEVPRRLGFFDTTILN